MGSGGKIASSDRILPLGFRASLGFSRRSVREMTTQQPGLEPIEPRKARELYLDHKRTAYTEATVRDHSYQTESLVEWCEENGIDNLNDLTGRDVQEYRLWRKENSDIKLLTLNKYMSVVRVFLRWCASIEAVQTELHEKVMIPRVSPPEQRADEIIEPDTAKEILGYLDRFHYASLDHVLFALLWETGMRLGAVRGVDVPDVEIRQERIVLCHRPNRDTNLKNGSRGERPVAITSELATIIDDYVDRRRRDVTDQYGRAPLFASRQGRMSRATLRRHVYEITAPCFRDEYCGGCAGDSGSKCEDSVSPHAIRRGSITHYLAEDVPAEVVSGRMNVSRDVLDKHYDCRTEDQKLEQRRGFLEEV
jgi:integrase